jgi:large subunit ribosomal protein L4
MALTLDVHAADGTTADSVELDSDVFEAPINVPVMHQGVVAQMAAARSGTSKTKGRGEVRGGGSKPWRQKGTGRARHGSIRAPQWSGGGVAHGPDGTENYTKRVPKKLKRIALRSALSDRAASGDVRVVEALDFEAPKTKDAVALIDALELADRRVLLVLGGWDVATVKSFRNLQDVHVLRVDQLNTYDVLVSDVVVFEREALDLIGTGRHADLEEVAPA